MFRTIPAATTANSSTDVLDRVITSEIQYLIDMGHKTISAALHDALAQRHRMVINELNDALDVAGRTGTASPQPVRLEPLLRSIPEHALANCAKYGSYFTEHTHLQLVASMNAFQSFIEQESRFLIKKRAKKISPDFFQALAQLSKLQTAEIVIRLEIAAVKPIHAQEGSGYEFLKKIWGTLPALPKIFKNNGLTFEPNREDMGVNAGFEKELLDSKSATAIIDNDMPPPPSSPALDSWDNDKTPGIKSQAKPMLAWNRHATFSSVPPYLEGVSTLDQEVSDITFSGESDLSFRMLFD